MSSANSDNLTSSFPICIPLTSLHSLTTLARTSNTILKRYGERGQPCLVPDFSGITSSFSPFSWCWLPVCCILLLWCLGLVLEFLFFPRLLAWKAVEFCQMLFLHLIRWSYDFFFEFVYVVYCIVGFPYIEPSLYSWDEAYLIMVDDRFDVFLARILLSIFASIFIREIGLKFSSFVGSLCGFGISITVAS